MDQQIRFCTARDGVRLAYGCHGKGPPLIKAAHYLTHLEFDWRSPFRRHWLTEFGRDRMMIRYDERGSRLSDWHVEDISLDAWATLIPHALFVPLEGRNHMLLEDEPSWPRFVQAVRAFLGPSPIRTTARLDERGLES